MLLLLMMVSFGFVSCSDDDEGSADTSLLYGRWELVHYQGFYYDYDGQRVEFDEPGYGEYYEFFDNGTAILSGEGEIFTWSLSGNRLTISAYGESETATITSLTGTELVIESSGRDEDGEYYEKLTFRRAD